MIRWVFAILMGTMTRHEQLPSNTEKESSHENQLESFLFNELPQQYLQCTDSLRAVGLLEPILSPESDDVALEMCEGVTGMDGKAYALPTLEQITKHFSQEKYKWDISRGFTKLLIVPFAYPLATIRARYEQALIKHHKEGELLDRDGNPLDLDTEQPLYFEKDFDKSDETGDMIYYPKQFDTVNHGGFTKQEILDDSNQPFPGFHILLIKPEFTFPRYGESRGVRKYLSAGHSPKEYLKGIQTHQLLYGNVQGMTLEDSLTLALTNLHETNRVIDDFENEKDSANFNIANFYKPSGKIPYSYWWRRINKAIVQEYSALIWRDDRFGARFVVG